MGEYIPGMVGISRGMLEGPSDHDQLMQAYNDLLRISQQGQTLPIGKDPRLPQQAARRPMNDLLRGMAGPAAMGAVGGMAGTPGIVTAGLLAFLQSLAKNNKGTGSSGGGLANILGGLFGKSGATPPFVPAGSIKPDPYAGGGFG